MGTISPTTKHICFLIQIQRADMSSYHRGSYYADKVNEMLNIRPVELETTPRKINHRATNNQKTTNTDQAMTTFHPKSMTTFPPKSMTTFPPKCMTTFPPKSIRTFP